MEKNPVCPRCGTECKSGQNGFMCNHCGVVFSKCEASFLSEAIFSGTIKTESTVMQTIEQYAGIGGEGTPIVLQIGGNQSGD